MAYTTIDDPSEHYQTMTYCGNGSARSLTNSGNSDLQPDLVWIKGTSGGANVIQDSSRGAGYVLLADSDDDEFAWAQYIQTFNSDGFSILAGDGSTNTNANKYMAWQWKLNGGTTTTNNDGNRSVTLQANATAGQSLGLYEGSGADGATYGHGLGAVPDMVIMKNRDSDNYSWMVWHSSISPTSQLTLDGSGAKSAAGGGTYQTFTSSVIALESASAVNVAQSFMFLAFTGIAGYSSFGRWTGNVSTNGPFIYTGFKPAFILWKPTGAAENWIVHDSIRSITGSACGSDRENSNPVYDRSYPNLQTAASSSQHMMDILSNGFKIRTADTAWNGNGLEYIYAAFAESPFVTSSGVPTTAR